MDKVIHQRVFMGTKANGRGIVKATAKLHQLGGNNHPYFSITTGNGCDHDLILESMPHLKLLVDLHLADDHGMPAHGVANAAYYLDNKDDKALAKHLRIPVEEARSILSEYLWHEQDAISVRQEAKNKLLQLWRSRVVIPEEAVGLGAQFKNAIPMRNAICRFYNEHFGVNPKVLSATLKDDLLSLSKDKIHWHINSSWVSKDVRDRIRKLYKLNTEIIKHLEKWVNGKGISADYMEGLIKSCFLSFWQRQADEAIEILQGEDEHLKIVPEAEDPYIMVDGEILIPEEFYTSDYLPEMECGDRRYHVALNSEEAGVAAREYWKDMANTDPSEFACMVGEDNLVKWGMGQPAGPGSKSVSSMDDWLDLWLDTPHEHWARYDGKEVSMEVSREACGELGFEFSGDINDDTITIVAYRT